MLRHSKEVQSSIAVGVRQSFQVTFLSARRAFQAAVALAANHGP